MTHVKSQARSTELRHRATRVIPRAAQTLSKSPDQFVQGVTPYALASGEGCRVRDVDGNEYLDFTSALGAIILGYRYPAVEEAVRLQRSKGGLFGLPGDIEVALAERLREILPFAEMCRFGMNGSDVTTGAIRVARAYTGRERVAKCGYHGWPDWTIATNKARNKGVPQAVKNLTHEFSYNKLETLERIFAEHPNQIAAVILEPIDAQSPAPSFLEGVRDLARAHGAVLIFDEMVTGFRMARGGAAEYFNVKPDLACYGKAISNGEPISALVGSREIMSVLDEVFFSFTYAGYLPSVAAALATLDVMDAEPVYEKIWRLGDRLLEGLRAAVAECALPISVQGYGAHPALSFKDAQGEENRELKTLFLQETIKAGILTNTKFFVTFTHEMEDIEWALAEMRKIFERMAEALRRNDIATLLEGPVVAPRYRP